MSQPRHRPAAAAIGACLAIALAAVAVSIAGCGGGDATAPLADARDGFDSARAFDDLRAQVELGPRPSGSPAALRLSRRLARELRRAGVDDVGIQRPLRNVVGSIPGRGDGTVVLGAHYDTKDIPGFVGANDGASGVAVVIELARALPNPMPGPSLSIALFDGEEARGDRSFEADGTRGSRQYVEYARNGRAGRDGGPALADVAAMVLLDMVGDCDLAVPREENSDADLYSLFTEAAPATFEGTVAGVEDDHVPFLDAAIPAVDLIDFEFGPDGSPGGWWHTASDDLASVCPESLDAVGGAALRALPGIEAP